MSIGNFPESLSQQILVGIILVGRLGVGAQFGALPLAPGRRGETAAQAVSDQEGQASLQEYFTKYTILDHTRLYYTRLY